MLRFVKERNGDRTIWPVLALYWRERGLWGSGEVWNINFGFMKRKIFALFAIVILAVAGASARDKVYRDASVLPQQAQLTLKKAFPKASVNRVKVDQDLLGVKDYEVVLNNGTEIEFSKTGEWKEVDCGHKAIPQLFVMKSIRDFIFKNHKGRSVVKIEKDDKRYDVELDDGTDMEFDRAGNFLRYD